MLNAEDWGPQGKKSREAHFPGKPSSILPVAWGVRARYQHLGFQERHVLLTQNEKAAQEADGSDGLGGRTS